MLTAFKVYYVLEGPPIGVMTKEEQRKREQDETLCKGYILKSENGASSSKVHYVDSAEKGKIKKMTRRGKAHGILPRTTRKTRNNCLRLCAKMEQVDTIEIIAMVSEMNIGMIQELHMASVTTNNLIELVNGVVERNNRVLQNMINDMLVSANLPKNLWGEALLRACHHLECIEELHGLGSFGEENIQVYEPTPKFSTQRLETASQNTCDAVTIPTMTVSQHSTTASARMTQPKI
ncbi:retrovirus-related pol polyprotein from transposon TNT 1-94 [Tanacetum coccineum]